MSYSHSVPALLWEDLYDIFKRTQRAELWDEPSALLGGKQ